MKKNAHIVLHTNLNGTQYRIGGLGNYRVKAIPRKNMNYA